MANDVDSGTGMCSEAEYRRGKVPVADAEFGVKNVNVVGGSAQAISKPTFPAGLKMARPNDDGGAQGSALTPMRGM